MKTFVFKGVIYGLEGDTYFILTYSNHEITKKYFKNEEEVKEYIEKNYKNFI